MNQFESRVKDVSGSVHGTYGEIWYIIIYIYVYMYNIV